MRLILASAFLVPACASAQSQQSFPDLTEIHTPASGSYVSYIDFVHHHRWQSGNVPQPVVQAAAECMAGVLYGLLTPQERVTIDSAAKGTGFAYLEQERLIAAFKSRVSRDQFAAAVDTKCPREQEAFEQAYR